MSKKADFRWLLKMALRDGKATGKKLSLFMASIVLGIAAVVAIQSFSHNLSQNIADQSRSLMGADFIIDSRQPPNDKVQQIIDSLGGPDAREINFTSMVAFPSSGGTRLVRVKGVEKGFPFYGTIETQPSAAAATWEKDGAALVDATVLLQLNVQPGDSIRIGELKLPVAGAIEEMPGKSAASGALSPPVIIPYRLLEKTGLIQKGSLVKYVYYFVANKATDLQQLDKELDPVLDAQGADLDTHTSTSRRMAENFENFAQFLNLVAFIALLLGCVGIASSVNIYIKDKLSSVAVLRCIGASRRQSFLIYLIQIAFMGLLGAVIGTGLGLLLQFLFPLLLQEFLPVAVEVGVSWPAVAMGVSAGLLMSVLFALLPLMSIWYVSPLQVIRLADKQQKASFKARLWVFLAILAFMFLFSFMLLDKVWVALAFVGGIFFIFVLLSGMAQLLMKTVKRYFPDSLSFVFRQSLSNLFRPDNQTVTLIVAIGVGTFLISTLYFTKDFLLARTTLKEDQQSPNIIAFDVQTGQKAALIDTVRAKRLPVINQMPIVTMRVDEIKGVSANTLRKDTTNKIRDWVLNHEFRVTYRDSLISSERIVDGKWVPQHRTADRIPISISENFAEDARVGVGDRLVFDVQGVRMPVEVASIRSVDWSRIQTNFSIVFPEGVLEKAPQFYVVSTKAPDAATSAELQQTLVKNFPNVSVLDLRQMLIIIQRMLEKISVVITFMAFFSMLTGIIVLIGAVRTSKYQRIRENVLLRTIGARGHQLLKITALEYAYLGLFGSLTGVLLSFVSSFLLAWCLFDTAFVPSLTPLILFPAITLLTTLIGLSNSREVINRPPLEVFRKAGI